MLFDHRFYLGDYRVITSFNSQFEFDSLIIM